MSGFSPRSERCRRIGHEKHEKTQNLIENAHRFERLTPQFGDEVWSSVSNPKVFIFVPFGVFCGQSFELFRLEKGGA
jgi:hypothetical protein